MKQQDVATTDPVEPATRSARIADNSCPSCDAPGAWQIGRRSRFNPFGAVTLLVVAFWAALIGQLVGIGPRPALIPLLLGIYVMMASRKAQVCKVCGYVKRGLHS